MPVLTTDFNTVCFLVSLVIRLDKITRKLDAF